MTPKDSIPKDLARKDWPQKIWPQKIWPQKIWPNGRRRSGMQAAAGAGRRDAVGLVEQFGQLFGDGAAEFFGVDDGDGAAIIARDVMADADRDQLDRRAGFDLLD